MKAFLQQVQHWKKEKKKIVLARVIQTWGSSPRPAGSCMFISDAMEMAGSVSGGCVEGAVLKESQNVFETGEAKQLAYGVSDDDAWAVGLSCGGKIQVYLQPWGDPWSDALFENLSANRGCLLVTQLVDGKEMNALLSDTNISGNELPEDVMGIAKEAYDQRRHKTVTQENTTYFIHVFPPRSKMIIVGASHIASDLIQLARDFDFETIVVDPRRVFARQTSFPAGPDHLYEVYPSEILNTLAPDPYTYAVILSHDPKIDDDALKILLRSRVAYIGALGSSKNHKKRMTRLQQYGFTEEEINRINAPIGVDIHAQGAKEIALSIMAAIIRAKNAFI